MEWLFTPEALIALATLTALEIVLGIDNIIFISILAGKLPPEQQAKARFLGLAFAMITRLALLFSITWVMQLTNELFSVFGKGFSGRDLILLSGGLFLLYKSTREIHEKLEGDANEGQQAGKAHSFAMTIIQIGILDIVFSLDSVITAVGMTDQLGIMVIAVIIAVVFMMVFAGKVSAFVDDHPTIKILALSFLIMIGAMLVAESMHFHVPKGYIYFAMAFSVAVEMLNIRMHKKRDPVQLHRNDPF